MSDTTTGNSKRIWARRQSTAIIQLNGRNHAQIPGDPATYPLFDYLWRVTLFNRNGEWIRVVDPSNPSDSPKQNKQGGMADSQLSEAMSVGQAKQELAALEARLKEGERNLAEQRRQFEEEMAQERAKLAAEWNRLHAQQSGAVHGSPRTLSVPVSHQPISFGSASTGALPEMGGSPRVPNSPQLYHSASGASLSSTQTTSSASSTESSPQPADRIMAKHTSSVSSDSFLNPPFDAALSSSLPNRPGWSGNVRPSPPGSLKSPVRAPSTPHDVDDSARKSFLPQGLRRVSSMPQSLPTEPYLPPVIESASDQSIGGSPTPRSAPSVESTPRSISADMSEDQRWTKDQCEEWLKSKLYPTTDPNDKTSSGQRAIHCASLDGHLQVVEYLISRGGVDVLQKDLLGNTPLICAASKGRLETVKWLLMNGAILDGKAPSGRSALHSAAAGGYLAVCQFLVDQGANPLDKEQFGKTPRNLAEAYQHKAVAEYLKTIEASR